jgi:formate dehydrogenase accessory protein FdhE
MTPASMEEIISALAGETSRRPETAAELDLHLALLRKVAQVSPAAQKVEASKGDAFNNISVDWTAAMELARAVLDETSARRPDLKDALAPLYAALNPQSFMTSAMNYLQLGYVDELPDGALWAFVLNYALRPWLRALATAALPTIELEKWQQGKCPVCGGSPDFAALVKEPAEGGRVLLCSRCDTEWSFPRANCPHCGDGNAKKQGYHPVGEGGRYRLYSCETCGMYIKTVDLRVVDKPLPLAAERVLTLGLDVAAQQAGYGFRAA